MSSNAAQCKARRTRLILSGKCVKGCGGEPVTDGGLCALCRDNARRYQKEKLRKFRLTNPPLPLGGSRYRGKHNPGAAGSAPSSL